MGPGPVILTLDSWVEQHLQEVLTAKSQTAFDDAFDAFVALDASITVNGQHMSRAEYKKTLWNDEAHETSGTVTFKGTVAVPKNSKAIVQTGEVGVFFEASIHRNPLLFNNNITASMNLVVEQVKSKHDEPSEFDGRQATNINQVFTDVASNVSDSH
ncbi:uncharacterized protein PHACADRAFT_261414 [Phanerochaete carnosa HHB-10118-sp]|uniref:Uncharacterized protein n=1 Tax=Phanerochaete carnosa (strain HHB-10118-sp) TaxID=650164 RepID=K5USC9_PHACS|nr:uncharacterized protein PHACADRAFT_261414 [Phanerochaete carnosa HHB-10118-sp]EKM52786.1 hypothetical protein PHACADRAFT_261414 [Phanerochaete carnosa HHB-10118-sp]